MLEIFQVCGFALLIENGQTNKPTDGQIQMVKLRSLFVLENFVLFGTTTKKRIKIN